MTTPIHPCPAPEGRHGWRPRVAITLVLNTAIAAFLTLIDVGGSFGHNLVFSHCIGFSMFMALHLAMRRVGDGGWLPGAFLVLPVFVVAGVALALLLTGVEWTLLASHGWQAILIGVMIGGSVGYFFYARERVLVLQAALRERALLDSEAERARVLARLRLLQAQVEPHFLFNTLANVTGLIEVEPARARRLLESLVQYLRASLPRVRAEAGTLGDELDLVSAYLEVLRLRMGERLHFVLDVPPETRKLAFPPMLLQPLVENAIHHGLEPKVAGGTVRVCAQEEGGQLRLSVEDDGVGLGLGAGGTGLGLSSVRERLAALYGTVASLEIVENAVGGVTVRLGLPCQSSAR